ncbi:uncharacterized protein BKA55DRAFT_395540 [Fusarium redolens]|jgi:hypothetical protein|uniref:Uncharacterized protein n=1 Tax=Fusarium redolens TaxID=48865 RepID=A0A9P9H235_FUSRE|nr:uncharacterized protein BKA55DRAFT_395540 [Fusarium redolens]KAH7249062.1 hypothetical protein BKA55DRAFT_395540 [Fusarium redolens]
MALSPSYFRVVPQCVQSLTLHALLASWQDGAEISHMIYRSLTREILAYTIPSHNEDVRDVHSEILNDMEMPRSIMLTQGLSFKQFHNGTMISGGNKCYADEHLGPLILANKCRRALVYVLIIHQLWHGGYPDLEPHRVILVN